MRVGKDAISIKLDKGMDFDAEKKNFEKLRASYELRDQQLRRKEERLREEERIGVKGRILAIFLGLCLIIGGLLLMWVSFSIEGSLGYTIFMLSLGLILFIGPASIWAGVSGKWPE